jgi:hypothetical protein
VTDPNAAILRQRCTASRWLLAALIVIGCRSSPSEPVAEPPEPDPGASECAAAVAEYDRVLAEPSRACAADKECGCFPGGVSDRSSCGGVEHQEKVRRLEATRDRFAAAGCRSGIDCAPRLCQPVCRDGACVNSDGSAGASGATAPGEAR